MTKRIKAPVQPIPTREEIEEMIGEIALLKINEQKITSQKNAAIAVITERFAPPLTLIDAELKRLFAVVQTWAEANPAEFVKTRSIKFQFGEIGFRLGNPTVKLIAKWTEKQAMEAMTSLGGWWTSYIRTKTEINREAILQEHAGCDDDDLRKVGLRITQRETFFIDPVITETEARMSEAAK